MVSDSSTDARCITHHNPNNSEPHMTGENPGGGLVPSAPPRDFMLDLIELQQQIAKLAHLVRTQQHVLTQPRPPEGPAQERWDITQRLASTDIEQALKAVENTFDALRTQSRLVHHALMALEKQNTA
jgi:hypothetical protein